MVDSDHEDEDIDIDKLELSSDSTDIITTKKRPRMEDSEDEAKNLPTKKKQNFFNEGSEILKKDKTETVSDKNGTDQYNIKEEKDAVHKESEQNIHESSLSELNTDKEDEKNKEEQDHKPNKQENGNESLSDKDNPIVDVNSFKINNKEKTDIKKEEEEEEGSDEDKEEEESKKKGRIIKNRTVDTEVVDGLELSVECASEKEESSSESEDEKEIKVRPKTEIVLDLNESDCRDSLSEAEKSDSQKTTDTLEIKSEKTKKKRTRTSFSKQKTSESEDSLNNNSDEDYSPRTKKKMKKLPMTNKAKRSMEPKRGRGVKKSYKKNTEDISDDESADSTEETNKTKTKDNMKEELSEKESSASKSNNNSASESNNSEDEEDMKNRRTRRRNADPENNRQIQALKKYIKAAGIRVKCFNDLWAGCKSNSAKIKRLKELLERNGISGRPTLEKCKRVKKKNERMREASELDVSNIISEGRVTRARRNIIKSTSPDTPQRFRETHKRIQSIVDSDSE